MLRAIIIFLSVSAFVTVSAIAFLLLVPDRYLKDFAEWVGSRAWGHSLSIGEMTTERGLSMNVAIAGVRLEQDDRENPILEIDKAEIAFDLMDLLKGLPTLTYLSVDGATARHFLGTDTDATDNSNTELDIPIAIESVDLSGVSYLRTNVTDNGQAAGTFLVDVLRASGSLVPGHAIELEGEGTYRDAPFTFAVASSEAEDLSNSDAIPLTIRLSGPVEADISTSVLRSGGMAPITFSVSGPTVAALDPLTPVIMPETPPFSLKGIVVLGDNVYDVSEMVGEIGDSDISGALRADLSGELPFVEGKLRSQSLDFDDLASLIGAPPDISETASDVQRSNAETAPLLPQTPVPSDALRTLEFDIQFVAENVSSPLAQVEAIDARLRLNDARLEINPLTIGVSGGRAEGEIALNVRQDRPSADIGFDFTGVSLMQFFEGSQFAQETGGQMSGSFYLLGSGASLDDMFASAQGRGQLVLREGKLSALLVEAAGIDVAEALGVLLTGDDPVAMPCAGISLTADQGRIDIQRAEAATTDSLVAARGAVALDNLSYNIQLEAQAWDFSLLDLNAPVQISGVKTDYSVSIGQIEGLPLFAQGTDAPRDCDALFDRLTSQ